MANMKVTVKSLGKMKLEKRKICAVVTYSYTMAKLADEAGVDFILVGDSSARVISGFPNHTPVRLEEMIYHTRAVSSACRTACVMADLPDRTFAGGEKACVEGAMALVADGGAACVKVEGGSQRYLNIVSSIAEVGIPVFGHFGMPTAVVDQIGAYRDWIQGEGSGSNCTKALVAQAVRFEEAGCCGLLLSKIEVEIAHEITQALKIPTIGIGSGPYCDGQILVLEDLLGLTQYTPPYYLKKYALLSDLVGEALRTYIDEVRSTLFPDEKYSSPK